jgi:O-antigen/teichoic acid export membrane protein
MGAFPEVVSRFDEEGPASAAQFLSHLMGLMFRLCLPVAALLVALAGDITNLALPAEYHGHIAQLFPVIAFSVLCANLTSFVYGDVVHAHKRPWLLSIPTALGSVGTIALSLLLVPPLAELGAATALAGGSLVSLIACVVISERLTPIPVPWRHIGVTAIITLATGLAASLVSTVLGELPIVFKLMAGGMAGGIVFLGLNALFDPAATVQLTGKLKSRLGMA